MSKSVAPVALADDLDSDLDRKWEETIARCSAIAEWDLRDRKTLTVEQVVAELKPPKNDKSGMQKTAQMVFKKTLVCVDRFGSIIAQATGVVFGPSQQCFNAISFVIRAVQSYDAVFDAITALMERLSVFLDQLRFYLDDRKAEVKLDRRLRPTVYSVLDHFLYIMAKAHSLTHGWKGRLKLAAKVGAFGEDGGVTDAMAKLETLIANVTTTQITVIGKDLSEAAKSIRGMDEKLDQLTEASEKTILTLDQLAGAESSRFAREQDQKDLETMKKVLNVDETKKTWEEVHANLRTQHIEGIGQWLLDYRFFSRWADPQETAVHFFALKAPPGFGKSFLSSVVVDHVKKRHNGNGQVCVAYYYFQKESGEKSEKTSVLNRAVRALIWQLASQGHREFVKTAVQTCARNPDDGNTSNLWKMLITDVAKTLHATFFIVLDGIDELEADSIRVLVDIIIQIRLTESSTLPLTVRIFLAGTEAALDPMKTDHELSFPEINLNPPTLPDEALLNESDLILYTEERLSRMGWFLDAANQELSDLKDRIKAELSRGARGDYSALDLRLDDISRAYNIGQVEEILKRASQSRTEEIALTISALNETLDKGQIQVLNEILIWVTAGYEWFMISEYEAILSLQPETQSLFALEKQIRDLYARVLTIDENKNVKLKTEDIEKYLLQLGEALADKESAHFRVHGAFEDSEVALVKRVVRTHFVHVFGDDDVYTKFDFDKFFESKLGDQAVRIRLASRDRHIKIAQGCLKAMCDNSDNPRFSDFLSYACWYFPDHLSAINVDDADTMTRQDIGRKLVRLLRDPTLINAWWTQDRMDERNAYVFKAFDVDPASTIVEWLKDPVVQKGMLDMPSERQWVITMTSEGTPSIKIFENVAKIMAERWFKASDNSESEVMISSCSWLCGYLTHMRGEEMNVDDTPSVQLIVDVEQLAKSLLANSDLVGRWHTQLAMTLFNFHYFSESIARYRQALELQPDNWRLQYNLAKALGSNEDYDEAVLISSRLLDNEEILVEYWRALLYLMGTWNVARKELASAEALFKRSLEHGLQHRTLDEHAKTAVLWLTRVLNEQGKFSETVHLLEDLAEREVSDEVSCIATLFHHWCSDDKFHGWLSRAASRAQMLEAVLDKYEIAIEAARTVASSFNIYLQLRLHLGRLKWTSTSPDSQDAALDLWEESIHQKAPEGFDDYSDTSWTRTYTVRHLAPALLSKAKSAGLGAPIGLKAIRYTERLENLVNLSDLPALSDSKDPHLTLARLYHLSQNDTRARKTIREFMKAAFDQVEGDNSDGGFYNIAIVLQSLDDDTNALAAWCQFSPNVPDNSEESASTGHGSNESPDERPTLKRSATTQSVQAHEGAEPGTLDYSKDNAAAALPNGTSESEGATPDTLAADDQLPTKSKLEGNMHNHCDGECGVEWTYADDMYICKDCLDVQFDPDCYQKLKKGELDINICGTDHAHLHVPPFDEEGWRKMPKDHMMVGGTPTPRKEWIDRIKKNWLVDEESIKSVDTIQRAWLKHKAGASGTPLQNVARALLTSKRIRDAS